MKQILITGASSGVGEAAARYLVAQGYGVVLVGRNSTKLQALCNEFGDVATMFEYDLSDYNRIEEIFSFCKKQEIKLDGLVYSAGIALNQPMRSLDMAQVSQVMDINCMSFVAMCRHMTSRKHSNDGTSIVAISSLSAETYYPGTVSYSMSKSAVNAAVKVMAKELVRRRIRVNAILPANINTPMGPAPDDPVMLAQQPMGIIEKEYVAYLIEFLLSERSKYITGTLFPMSAGMAY